MSCDTVLGIGPYMAFDRTLKLVRAVRPPTAGFRVCPRLRLKRLMSVTELRLAGVELEYLQVIPVHEPSHGVPEDHLRKVGLFQVVYMAVREE